MARDARGGGVAGDDQAGVATLGAHGGAQGNLAPEAERGGLGSGGGGQQAGEQGQQGAPGNGRARRRGPVGD
jgi:hypothetical protein